MEIGRTRLAIVSSHPIQYYAPWFRELARRMQLRVFYLWDFGIRERRDPGFGREVQWDVPLLEGYEFELIQNVSRAPGTDRFFGLRNPSLRTSVLAWRPEAVLVFGYYGASLLDFILRWPRGRVPLLFRGDSHRLVTPGFGLKPLLRRRLISAIYKRFSAFLAVGSANREYFLQHGVRDEAIFRCPHAVDNERFAEGSAKASRPEWRAAHGISPDDLLFLFAGKLEEKKRPLDLLRAFAEAGVEGSTLLIVGNGEQETAVRGAAAWQRNVRVLPFQNQSHMPAVYAAADILVLPSFGPSETWGLCVNEAMACGRPAIVSDHVGCQRDLVQHGSTGWVFPAGDVRALGAVLGETFRCRGKLQAMGESARQNVFEKFSYAAASSGLEEALAAVA